MFAVLFSGTYSRISSAVPTDLKFTSDSYINTDTATARVIDFVCKLSYEDLPKPVVQKAKDLIASALSCMALGSGEPEGKVLRQYVQKLQGGAGSCIIFGADFTVNSTLAAFANAAQAQIHDANDGFPWAESVNACCHPGRLIIPAAVASAESIGASGKELITAVVAGYEFAGRAQKMTLTTRDLYVAALVAGKMTGLDAKGMSQALVMAAYNSPGRTGLPSPWADEYWLSNGQIVREGLEAVMMVQNGLHTSDILTSKKMPWDMIDDRLGDHWMVLETYIKPYPSCRNTHEAVDLALSLTKQNKLLGSDIARVDITKLSGFYVGAERLEPNATRMRAQLNIYHCVASAILSGKLDKTNFTPASIADEKVRALSSKVFLNELPKEQIRPDMQISQTKMTITMIDGKKVEGQEDYATGNPQSPLSPEKMRTLNLDRFSIVLPAMQSQHLYDAVKQIEDFADIREFTKLFRL